jgi:hypothetical protein
MRGICVDMGVLRNARLEVFAQLLAVGKPIYQAAREAGYNPDAPSFEANARSRRAKPEVRARIEELQQNCANRVADRVAIDRAWVLGQLADVASIDTESIEPKLADKLRALELLCRVQGYFAPSKVEIIQRLSELSLEELKALDERMSDEQQMESEEMH